MSKTNTLLALAVSMSVGLSLALTAPALAADEDGAPKTKQNKDKGVEKVDGDKPTQKTGADKPGTKVGGDKGGKPAEDGKGVKAPEDGKGNVKRPPQRDSRGYDRLRMGPNGQPMPADRTRSVEARRSLDEAKADLTKALGATSGNSTAAVDNELWKTDDYRDSMLGLRRAQADYDAVRRPIFDALRADAYYKELEKKQNASQRVISNLVLTGRGSFDWLFPHAMAALEVRNRMTREEIIAMAQAPEVEDARQRMLMAAAKVRAMRSNYVAQSTNSDAARTAKADLDAARDKVKEAQTEYNGALTEEAEYERIRQDYVAELRRTGRAPIAGGN